MPMFCSSLALGPQLRCAVPMVTAFISPGQVLDVVVSNMAGNVTLPHLFSMTTMPTLAVISKCPGYDTGGLTNGGSYCYTGSTITVLGSNFRVSANYTLVLCSTSQMWMRQTSGINITCVGLIVRDNNTLTCTLPELDEQVGVWFYDQYMTVLLLSGDSSPDAVNSLSTSVYQWPDAPSVSTISGCTETATAS